MLSISFSALPPSTPNVFFEAGVLAADIEFCVQLAPHAVHVVHLWHGLEVGQYPPYRLLRKVEMQNIFGLGWIGLDWIWIWIGLDGSVTLQPKLPMHIPTQCNAKSVDRAAHHTLSTCHLNTFRWKDRMNRQKMDAANKQKTVDMLLRDFSCRQVCSWSSPVIVTL